MDDRLLEVAIQQFGELGYEAASTRAIAGAAGTAMSTITYRYGGKEGLYLAAVGHIADTVAERIQPLLTPFADDDDPVDHVASIVRRFATMMLGGEAQAWSRLIVREQMNPTAAFDVMWGRVMKPVLDTLARRVIQATGETDPRAARATAVMLMGQAVILRSGRATVLRALDRPGIDEADTELILDRLEVNTRALLRRPEDK